ncbi:hypothetical protein HML84_14790 [Alcanivorax sp. IO_7]|nr:hypothetical protein HML84_14790 [Alcanivorax sp. IO_7]
MVGSLAKQLLLILMVAALAACGGGGGSSGGPSDNGGGGAETPNTPDNPDDPDNPDNPDNPDDPDNPDEPGDPDDGLDDEEQAEALSLIDTSNHFTASVCPGTVLDVPLGNAIDTVTCENEALENISWATTTCSAWCARTASPTPTPLWWKAWRTWNSCPTA